MPVVKQRLVDRVAAEGQLRDQRMQRNLVERDRAEHRAPPRGERLIHGAAQRGEQIGPGWWVLPP